MTHCKPGDVVLVRFPFTELTAAKRRPAVVISPADYSNRYHDVVVLALTGRNPGHDPLQLRDWRQAGLLKPTWVKPLIATVSMLVIHRRLGRLTDDDRKIASKVITLLIDGAFSGWSDNAGGTA